MEHFGVLITMSKNWYKLFHLPNFLAYVLRKISQNEVEHRSFWCMLLEYGSQGSANKADFV
jgi:hypothetical protein